MRIAKVGTACAALVGLAAGCGGGSEDLARQVAEVRAKADARAAEVETLQARLKSVEERSRSLEEQLAGLATRGALPAARPAVAKSPAEASAAEESAASAAAVPSPGAEVASFLDSEAGRQKMREFLASEEKEKEERQTRAMQEQVAQALRDRVTGYWTEQLGLDKRQQDAVIAVGEDAMKRMTEVWRGMRDARNDPASFQAARDKSQQILQDAKDQLAQALTVDQYAKFKDLGGENPGGLLGGAFGRGGMMGGMPGAGGPGAPRGGRGGGGGGQDGGLPPR